MPELSLDKDRRVYYQFIPGNTNKPYLVYLHEGLGCTSMWSNFPELLCRTTGCPGLLYDRLGYGRSSPLDCTRTVHYLHNYALKELPEILETVIPNISFILIGHSDGGSISLIFGAERPDYLKGIITEAAHVSVDSTTVAGIRVADEAWDKGKLRGLTKYHGEKTETVFKAWSETWLSDWFRHWNIEYLLPSVEVPLLALQGCDDQYGSKDQINSIASKCSGDVQLKIVKDCAHAPHLEAQPVVIKLMSEFIKQIIRETK